MNGKGERFSINVDVYHRAKRRAQVLGRVLERSPFLRSQYTGRMLEQDHALTYELTPTGLRVMRVILPINIALSKATEKVVSNPAANSAFLALAEPIMRPLGLESRTRGETLKSIRAERMGFEDLLHFNLEKHTPRSRIRTIDAQGNIFVGKK